MNALVKGLAMMIIQDKAYHNGRFVWHASDFTESDMEEIEILRNQLFNLFRNSNGLKWKYVLNEIKRLAGFDAFIGFRMQDKIIKTCKKYGYEFVV